MKYIINLLKYFQKLAFSYFQKVPLYSRFLVVLATKKKMVDVDKEYKFARNIREKYCNNLGQETNPTKAAENFHQIALIYRNRSPDKISRI